MCNRNTIRNQQHIHGSSRTSNTERKPNLVCLTNNRVTNSTQTSPASSNITAKVHEIRSISVRTYCINLHSFFKVIEFVLTCILYFVRKKCEKKNKSTQNSTYLIAKAVHSQWCHHKHSLCETKGQADSW